MTTHFTPTDEQNAALDMAMTGNSFKVVAYAGAGKTSTLRLISQHRKGRGLYLAFNKAIATEAAEKFAPHVRCQTFHSLAFRHVDKAITAKISLPKLTPSQLAEELRLKPIEVSTIHHKRLLLSTARLGMIIGDSLANFCKTSAPYPAARHIVLPPFIAERTQKQLQEQLYPALEQRWLQSIDPRHHASISHDIYLKLWTLSRPTIPADFVLFDEAQDADPLMMGVLMHQSCQTIYVGDAHQQIYEWRGAINAMKRLPYEQVLLTQSFRFGQDIADVANVFLKTLQETVPLRGNPAQKSTVSTARTTQTNAILCRTNAAALSLVIDGQKKGRAIALQADTPRILRFCQGAQNLQNNTAAIGVPELSFFKTWEDVQEFAQSHDGSEIKTWVNLIDEHGTHTIQKAINQLVPPKNAQYIISTAHKSKGLEWHNVQIFDDFLYENRPLSVKISGEELRLLYVACTRAQNTLNIHHIRNLIQDLQNKKVIFV